VRGQVIFPSWLLLDSVLPLPEEGSRRWCVCLVHGSEAHQTLFHCEHWPQDERGHTIMAPSNADPGSSVLSLSRHLFILA
jgi:hypothetical protein